jgi:hypothetical protein
MTKVQMQLVALSMLFFIFVLAVAFLINLHYGQDHRYCYDYPSRYQAGLVKVYKQETGRFPESAEALHKHMSTLLERKVFASEPCVTSVSYKEEPTGFIVNLQADSFWFGRSSRRFNWEPDAHSKSIQRSVDFYREERQKAGRRN